MLRILLACFLVLLLATTLFTSKSITLAQDEPRTFEKTGQTVRGRFLAFWEANGKVERQGYPLTGEIQEISPIDGKLYTVQYFERAVFELHLENKPPFDVLLSQLGTFQYRQKYPAGAPAQTPDTSPGSVTFPETGKRVGGKFLSYWEQNGGLAQQGLPISDAFEEKSDLDGKTYTVQYFERAVFELHPENPPPYDVLLPLLGSYRLAQTSNGRFLETGQTIQEPFLTYWNSHGGPTLIGLPLSPELVEKSELDGLTYKKQYYEYQVLEYHPEMAPPNNVIPAYLGVLRYRQKYHGEAPAQSPNISSGSIYFPQTGKRLGGKSLDNWRKTGAAERNGLPISDEFPEKNDHDGKVYLVQYFQGSVFELHPELEAPDDVQMVKLGKERYELLYPPKADIWTNSLLFLSVLIVAICLKVLILWVERAIA